MTSRFQAELKELCLPVSIILPDVPKPDVHTPGSMPGDDKPSGSLTIEPETLEPEATEPDHIASGCTAQHLSVHTKRPKDKELGAIADSPDVGIPIGDQIDILSGLGIRLRIRTIRRSEKTFRYFDMQGTVTPLSNPSSIPGLEKVKFQPFDVFFHVYLPSSAPSPTRQLWVWEPSPSSGSLTTCSWKSVAVGYICPGPGVLKQRHLVISDQGEPGWVTGSTRYRWYE